MGDLETSIKLTLDTGKSLSNLNQFASAFRRQMLDIGKTKLEIDWIEHLAEEVRAGETALESLSEEMRGFVAEFNSGRQVAADRDALGLKEHAEVERQIEETRASMKAANEVIDAGLYDAGVGDEAAKSLEQPFAAAEKLKEQMDAASEAARGLGISLAEFGPVVTPEFEKVTGQVDTL
ncbi:MAG: hypothetical protein LBQ81_09895, partial [Zoogloeaceae bacterium]|nr:hypothetical protein [Zoogloeaceae bacterium]